MEPRMNPQSFVGRRLFFVASGAGSRFQHDLWMVPGTSGFLVGTAFPYAQDDTNEFLGFKPEKYCSREEALQLAMEAYMRARRNPTGKAIGLAMSAAVASSDGPPRRGEHRVYVAVISSDGCYLMKKTLDKNPGYGRAQRARDDGAANLAAEDMLRIALGEWTFDDAVEANAPGSSELTTEIERVEDAELQEIFFKHPFFGQGGGRGVQAPADMTVFYPGAFNPLHDGHRHIMHNVGNGTDATYVVNVDSVHKPALSICKMLEVAAQFRTERLEWRQGSVLFTRGEALFIDKFKRHPESFFVVGVDTFERMLDPTWGVVPREVLMVIHDYNINLWVCDRIVDGTFKSAFDAIKRMISPGDAKYFMTDRHIEALDVEPSALSSSAIRAASDAA